MATDIAFAVGILGLLGRGIPPTARIFLLTFAGSTIFRCGRVRGLMYPFDVNSAGVMARHANAFNICS